jgi:hypothetical protein
MDGNGQSSDRSDDDTQGSPVDALVEQFLQRRRQGEALDVEAYCREHEPHAAALRELLPMLVALEDVKRDRSSSGSGRRKAQVPPLERLGDFKIVREIGRGGMGVVFEAVQESLGRKVALKVLPQSALLSGNQLERFVREAQIAAQLHHSNIVPVYGSGESDGYHWYAMQFIVGQSLDRWQEEQREAPPRGLGAWRARARFTARLGLQIADALHYAHGLGTLHRDVKPGNLLLEASDHLWVTDFGLAKALEAEGLTHSGDVLGTLQYMAPEQFAGSYDARSEVYALGVTLYELLTLRPAFAGSSRSELMERIRTSRPESLRKLCPELPLDLVVVVEKAMAREVRDRYQDAAALARDLQAFLDDRPIAARPLSALAQVWRWCRRNRGMAALAASTLLAVVAAGVTGWVGYVIAEQERALTKAESQRADTNLKLALAGFGDVFDTLIGRDPMLALEVDPDTGEQTVIARQVVDPRSIAVLERMLRFYDDFAAKNAGDQQLVFETARANRRVGAIHVRLGKPDNLASAQKAYEQALQLLARVTDRDITREQAAVKVDLGKLAHRGRDLPVAARHFQEALAALDKLPAPQTVAVRFERAQVHFLLAQLVDAIGGPRGGGPGGPGDEGRRLFQGAQRHQKEALALVDELLQGDADNVEVRALQARCLLLTGRLRPGRRGEPPSAADSTAEAERQRGLAILTELVAAHPEAEHLRFALAEGMLGDRGPRGRRDELFRRDEPPSAAERETALAQRRREVDRLREAKAHAHELTKQQPKLDEYTGLLLRASVQLARSLRAQAQLSPAAEQGLLRQQALQELADAIALGAPLAAADSLDRPRFVRDLLDARRLRCGLLAADARWSEVGDEVQAVAELIEQHLQRVQAAGEGVRVGGPGATEGRELQYAIEMAEELGRQELAERLRTLQGRWAAAARRPR